MKVWRLGAALILAAWVAGCGGNSTPIGVTVAPTGTSTAPFTVLLGETQQFTGIVGGSTTTGVTWSICLPAATVTTLPTNCPPGFGTINANGLYTPPTSIPNPNLFNVVATSVANPKAFGVSFVSIVSGVRVQVTPTSATIGTGETLQVTASVTGAPNNSSFSFVVSGNGETDVPGGDLNTGIITPGRPLHCLEHTGRHYNYGYLRAGLVADGFGGCHSFGFCESRPSRTLIPLIPLPPRKARSNRMSS